MMSFSCGDKEKSNQKDYSYDRGTTLKKIEKILNKSAPEYKEIVDDGFSNIDGGIPIGYSVFDLTNPSNKSKKTPEDTGEGIEFIEGHFYHFSPVIMSMSYSHIAFFSKGEMITFSSINCLDKGDSFNSVLEFIKDKPSIKKEVINNIKNYRRFGYYHIEDNYGMSINCDCDPCE